MPDRKPAFIIIGAVKGATTWIAHQLRCHPDLWLPDAEPHYFSTEYARGEKWYAALFEEAPADRIVGEKSADYLAHPEAAARMAGMVPDARLIVQLRDPVQRAYSDYCMLFRRGMVKDDPRPYLDGKRAAQSRFLEGGLYGRHLNRLLHHYRRDQLHVIFYETLRTSADKVVAEVCDHIGVRVHMTPQALSMRQNDSASPMLPLGLRRFLKPMRPVLDPLRANPLFSRLRASLATPVHYPPLTEELRAMLRDYYRTDMLVLQDLLKTDLSGWLSEIPQGAKVEARGTFARTAEIGRTP